jgi:hypothetical protein
MIMSADAVPVVSPPVESTKTSCNKAEEKPFDFTNNMAVPSWRADLSSAGAHSQGRVSAAVKPFTETA